MSTDASDIVAAVLRLPGVGSADLESDGEGFAVHVGLVAGADGDAVAHAVTRTLHEHLGHDAPPARVHVLDEEPGGPADAPRPTVPVQASVRPSIVRFDVATTALDHTVTVVLTSRTRAATGDARGVATASGLRRAAATATLRALERLLRESVRIELEQVERTSPGEDGTVVVVLTMLSARGTEQLTGAAVIRDDEPRAVVRATLDALNRRLEQLLS